MKKIFFVGILVLCLSGLPVLSQTPSDAQDELPEQSQIMQQQLKQLQQGDPEQMEALFQNLLNLQQQLKGTESLEGDSFFTQGREELQYATPLISLGNKLISHPDILSAMTEILRSGMMKYFTIAQAILLLSMLIFRSWWMSEAPGFLKRLWIHFTNLILYLFLSFAVIPILIFGESWKKLVHGIIEVAQTL